MSLQKAKRNEKPVNSNAKAPETLLQLFWLMVKSFVLNIPKTIVKQLIKVGVIFIIVFVVHAYLVVVKNQGFRRGLRVITQDHVGYGRCCANFVAHIRQAQTFIADTHHLQGDVFGNGKIFAVTRAAAHEFKRRGPIVFLLPHLTVGLVQDPQIGRAHV